MKTSQLFAGAAFALLMLPAFASAQVYYYAPGTTSGAYNYDSYIPASAMPYVNLGYQMQQQSQQQYQSSYYTPSYSYSYPSSYQYQSQSQSQYQTSYPSYYTTSYSYPNSSYSYANNSIAGYYTSEPQSTTYPTGTTGPFGTPMCYWSDYPTYAPCGTDPQQWIQDPYTGTWY